MSRDKVPRGKWNRNNERSCLYALALTPVQLKREPQTRKISICRHPHRRKPVHRTKRVTTRINVLARVSARFRTKTITLTTFYYYADAEGHAKETTKSDKTILNPIPVDGVSYDGGVTYFQKGENDDTISYMLPDITQVADPEIFMANARQHFIRGIIIRSHAIPSEETLSGAALDLLPLGADDLNHWIHPVVQHVVELDQAASAKLITEDFIKEKLLVIAEYFVSC